MNPRDYIYCFGCSYDHPEDAHVVAHLGEVPTTVTEWNSQVVSWICWECTIEGRAVEAWTSEVKRDWPEAAFGRSAGTLMDELITSDGKVLPLLPLHPD